MKTKLIVPRITQNYAAELLHYRGIENVKEFCNPTSESLQSWRGLKNCDKAAYVVSEFIKSGRKNFGLLVDCDVDGYTSSSILYQYLKQIAPDCNITTYIHTKKQHGLEDSWEFFADSTYDIIFVPDAGSNDGIYVEKINEINNDCAVIVIDHHILEESSIIPNNMIVVNNQASPDYHNKDLSGAGMVYQFCNALDTYFNTNFAINFIDLAALGICADMMSGLSIENQYFLRYGFSHITNKFFKYLCEKQSYSMQNKINPISVAFYIVPMINATIRVGTQEEKERLFAAFVDSSRLVESHKRGSKGLMVPVIEECARECTNAKNHQNKEKEEIVARLEQKIFKHDLLENQILFIKLDDDDIFPSELNGLVSMQLSAKYKRPTIVARLNDEGYIRGSSRGVNNSALTSFKNYMDSTGLFEYTAGHDNACGISILESRLPILHKKANKELLQYNFGETYYEVEFEMQATDPHLPLLIDDIVKYESIWSQNCSEPNIHITDINVKTSDYDVVGANKDTLRIHKNGITYIKFHAKELIEEIKQMGNEIKFEVVGRASINEWGGRITPQILISEIDVQKDGIGVF